MLIQDVFCFAESITVEEAQEKLSCGSQHCRILFCLSSFVIEDRQPQESFFLIHSWGRLSFVFLRHASSHFDFMIPSPTRSTITRQREREGESIMPKMWQSCSQQGVRRLVNTTQMPVSLCTIININLPIEDR